MIEATIGEVKSNADITKARRQLSIALAVLELTICVLASPRSVRRSSTSSGGPRLAPAAPAGAILLPSAKSALIHDTLPMAPFYRALEQNQKSNAQLDAVSVSRGVNSSAAPTAGVTHTASPDGEVIGAFAEPGPLASESRTPQLDYRLTGLILLTRPPQHALRAVGLSRPPMYALSIVARFTSASLASSHWHWAQHLSE